MNKEPKRYSFNTKAAKCLGVDESILLEYISHWSRTNSKTGSRYLINGKHWTYGSIKHIASSYPFWTEKQVRRILSSLESKGAIEVGCYNKKGYDKTKWYALSDFGRSLTAEERPIAQTGKPIPILYNKNIDNKITFEVPKQEPISK
jgi:DNA-binding PadR family transcriptional regulator